jgi:hypothetical protein
MLPDYVRKRIRNTIIIFLSILTLALSYYAFNYNKNIKEEEYKKDLLSKMTILSYKYDSNYSSIFYSDNDIKNKNNLVKSLFKIENNSNSVNNLDITVYMSTDSSLINTGFSNNVIAKYNSEVVFQEIYPTFKFGDSVNIDIIDLIKRKYLNLDNILKPDITKASIREIVKDEDNLNLSFPIVKFKSEYEKSIFESGEKFQGFFVCILIKYCCSGVYYTHLAHVSLSICFGKVKYVDEYEEELPIWIEDYISKCGYIKVEDQNKKSYIFMIDSCGDEKKMKISSELSLSSISMIYSSIKTKANNEANITFNYGQMEKAINNHIYELSLKDIDKRFEELPSKYSKVIDNNFKVNEEVGLFVPFKNKYKRDILVMWELIQKPNNSLLTIKKCYYPIYWFMPDKIGNYKIRFRYKFKNIEYMWLYNIDVKE